jgi:cysteinylglycine-S-conjugate dipeptidase
MPPPLRETGGEPAGAPGREPYPGVATPQPDALTGVTQCHERITRMRELSPQAARSAIAALFPSIKNDLAELARIPSVSAPGFDPGQVRRSAEATAALLQRSGLTEVRLLEIDGAYPAVYGHTPGPAGAPTVLLYAHHDIQPPGPAELWASPPFEPAERDGRLYGRGTADDKAGIVAHAAALRAWQGKPPVGVTVFIEGEEESTSEHLEEFLSRYSGLLNADAVIAADCSNWRIGQPAVTTSLRGLAECVVEVRTLDHAVHSGIYGGPVPDALTALSRLLATLHDQAGTAAIAGLESGACDGLDLTDAELRQYAGVRPGVQLTGEGSLTGRMWAKPSVAVLGIDAPSIQDAAAQLAASARAKISMRLAPGDDPAQAMRALTRHLQAHAPWGAEVTVTPGDQATPAQITTADPAFGAFRRACTSAWDTSLAETGIGGTIPFVSALATALPRAAILLTGVQDPHSNVHAQNESLHLGDFEKYCVAQTLFLGYLGASG